jgi:predicted small lipoprotein YifL
MRALALFFALSALVSALSLAGCGAKGAPVPAVRHPPAQCAVKPTGLRTFEATLPLDDTTGKRLPGLEALRVYYLQMESRFPSSLDVVRRGEVVLELRKPDLPPLGGTLALGLSRFGRQRGWLVVVPLRVGDVHGVPSKVLPWLDPSF